MFRNKNFIFFASLVSITLFNSRIYAVSSGPNSWKRTALQDYNETVPYNLGVKGTGDATTLILSIDNPQYITTPINIWEPKIVGGFDDDDWVFGLSKYYSNKRVLFTEPARNVQIVNYEASNVTGSSFDPIPYSYDPISQGNVAKYLTFGFMTAPGLPGLALYKWELSFNVSGEVWKHVGDEYIPSYKPSGYYVSPCSPKLDEGFEGKMSAWDRVSVSGYFPAGSSYKLWIQSSDKVFDWTDAGAVEVIDGKIPDSVPLKPYVRYKVDLYRGSVSTTTPQLNGVNIGYGIDAHPPQLKITSTSSPMPPSFPIFIGSNLTINGKASSQFPSDLWEIFYPDRPWQLWWETGVKAIYWKEWPSNILIKNSMTNLNDSTPEDWTLSLNVNNFRTHDGTNFIRIAAEDNNSNFSEPQSDIIVKPENALLVQVAFRPYDLQLLWIDRSVVVANDQDKVSCLLRMMTYDVTEPDYVELFVGADMVRGRLYYKNGVWSSDKSVTIVPEQCQRTPNQSQNYIDYKFTWKIKNDYMDYQNNLFSARCYQGYYGWEGINDAVLNYFNNNSIFFPPWGLNWRDFVDGYNVLPAASTNLTGTAISQNSIKWTWTDNSGNVETGFKLYDNSANLKATIGRDVTNFTETGLAANTWYYRYIRVYNSAGENWDYSSSGGACTLPVVPNVTCNNTTTQSWWYLPFVFTNSASFGTGGVHHYHYKWNQNPSDTAAQSDSVWSSGNLYLGAPANGSWYLHVVSHNSNDVSGGTKTYGPYYFYNIASPEIITKNQATFVSGRGGMSITENPTNVTLNSLYKIGLVEATSIYEITPADTIFTNPAVIILRYPDSPNENLYKLYTSNNGISWTVVAGQIIDTNVNEISSAVAHVSYYTVCKPLTPLTVDLVFNQWATSNCIDTLGSVEIYAYLYIHNVTDQPGKAKGVIAELWNNFSGSWSALPMIYNKDAGWDEYKIKVENLSAGSYEYIARFSGDSGKTWVYSNTGNGGLVVIPRAKLELSACGADPSAFNPEFGEKTNIFYQLSQDANVTVTIDGQILINSQPRSKGLSGELWGGAGYPMGEHICVVKATNKDAPYETYEKQFKIMMNNQIPVVSIPSPPDFYIPWAPWFSPWFSWKLEASGYEPKILCKQSLFKVGDETPVFTSGWEENPAGYVQTPTGYYVPWSEMENYWEPKLQNRPYGLYKIQIEAKTKKEPVYPANPKEVVTCIGLDELTKICITTPSWSSPGITVGKVSDSATLQKIYSALLTSQEPKYLQSNLYNIGPAGTTFSSDRPGILIFDYPSNLCGESLAIYKFDETLNDFVLLEKQFVYSGKNQVIAEIDRVGIFALLSPVDKTVPTITNVSITPSPFSPDNDGSQDTTTISYTLGDDLSSYIPWTTIKIYDSQNNLIKTLVDNLRRELGVNQEIWNGKDNSGKVVPVGTYTCKIEIADLVGNKTETTGTINVFYTEIVDITPPTTPVVVDGGDYTRSTSELSVSWLSEDPDSEIVENWYGVGTLTDGSPIGQWEQPITVPLSSYHSSFIYNNRLYILNGSYLRYATIKDDGSVPDYNHEYDKWTMVYNLPINVSRTAVLVNGKIYLLGYSAVYFGQIDPISGAIATWQTTTGCPGSYSRNNAVVNNRKIYTFAGRAVYYASVKEDGTIPATGQEGTWKLAVGLLPENLDYTTSIVYKDRIYVIGGIDRGVSPWASRKKVYCGDVDENGDIKEWREILSLPETRHSHSAAINGYGMLYVIGGYDGYFANYKDTIYYARIDAGTGNIENWDTIHMPYPIIGNTSTFYNGWLYVTGQTYYIQNLQYAPIIQRIQTEIVNWTSVGKEQSVKVTGLNLFPDKRYYFSVKTLNKYNLWSEVGYSDGIKVVTDIPGEVKNLSVTNAGCGQRLFLRWDKSTEPDVIGYNIYKSTTRFGGYEKINITLLSDTQYMDKGLENWQRYYYQVTSVNQANKESARGLSVSGVPSIGSLVENTAPNTTLSYVGGKQYSSGDKLYASIDTQYTLTAIDQISEPSTGIDYTEYKVDDGQWQRYIGAFYLTAGVHTLDYRSIDNVGNTELAKSQPVAVDITSPQSTFTVIGPNYLKEQTTYLTSHSSFSLSGTDDLSGVAFANYQINNIPYQTYQNPFAVSQIKMEGELKVSDWTYGITENLTTTDGKLQLITASGKVYFIEGHRIGLMNADGTNITYFGSQGSGVGQFKNPSGISYDSVNDYIYVADMGNYRIVRIRIDDKGQMIDWLPLGGVFGSGTGKFYRPSAISCDPSTGYLYIVDSYGQYSSIIKTKIDTTGWNQKGLSAEPGAIFYDPASKYLYYTIAGSRIVKEQWDGVGYRTFGSAGSGVGQFNFGSYNYRNLYYDSKTDYIYVADSGNDRIIKTKIDGTGWTPLGTSGSGIKQFEWPTGITYDSESEYVYVSDTPTNRVIKTKIDGTGWVVINITISSLFYAPPLGYVYSGSFTSDVYDFTAIAEWRNIKWVGQTPSGTSITIQTRTGNTFVPDATWSGWSQPYTSPIGEPITSPFARYIQLKTNLATQSPTVSPALNEINIESKVETVLTSGVLKYWSTDNVGNVEAPPKTLQFAIDDTPPVAISGLVLTLIDADKVKLIWTANTESDLARYNIYRQGVKINTATVIPAEYIDAGLVPGEYAYYVTAVDKLENESLSSEQKSIITADTVPPVSTLISFGYVHYDGTNSFTASGSSFTIISNDGAGQGVDYIVTNIDNAGYEIFYSTIPISFTAEGRHTIGYKSVDKAGNWEDGKLYEIIIDTTPSVTEIAVSTPNVVSADLVYVTSKTTFTLSAIDYGPHPPSGVKYSEYWIEGGSVTRKSIFDISTTTIDGTYLVSYYSVDSVDNKETDKYIKINFDNSPPETKILVGNPQYFDIVSSETWISGITPINISTDDKNGVGVDKVFYKIDDEDFDVFIGSFNILNQGKQEITYYGLDKLGNKESENKYFVNVDTVAPIITVHSPVESSRFIATISTITISYAVKDNIDLAPKIVAYLTDLEEGTTIQVVSGQIIEPLSIDDGFWTLTVEATDWVGNFSSSTTAKFEVIHDMKPPQTEIEIGNPKYDNAVTYLTSHTTLNLSAIDDLIETGDKKGLGVASSKGRVASGDWTTYTNPTPAIGQVFKSPEFKFENISEGQQTINYYSEDILANKEAEKEKKVIIDNTAPVSNYYTDRFLYQNDTTKYISATDKVTLLATDPDQNFLYNNFDKFKVISGSWTVTNGKFVQADNNITGYTKAVLPLQENWNEYDLDVKVKISSNSITQTFGALIYFNYQDENNWYALYLSYQNKYARVIKYENGIENILQTVNYPVELNRWYNIKLEVSSQKLEVRIFGEKIFDLPLTTFYSQLATIGFGSDSAIASFSNLRLKNITDFQEISLGSGLKDIYYSVDDQPQSTYYSPLALTEGIHTIEYNSGDNLTNAEMEQTLALSVDGAAPGTEFQSTQAFYNNLYVSSSAVFSFIDEDPVVQNVASGIFKTEYSTDLLPSTFYLSPFNLTEGKHTVGYYSIDNVENVETQKTKFVWIDAIAPTTTLNYTGGTQYTSPDGKLYASIDTQYLLSAVDPIVNEVASGVKLTKYHLDSGNWKLWDETPITLTEGIRTIEYLSIDNVNNTEQAKAFVVYVDNTSPETSVQVQNPQYQIDSKIYATSQTLFTLSAVDPVMNNVASGVSYTEYKILKNGNTIRDWTQYEPFVITGEDGIYTIEYRSSDNMSNQETAKSLTVYLDNIAPISEITTGQPKHNDYVTSDTNFYLVSTDSGIISCNVKYTEYRINNGQWTNYTTGFNLIGMDGSYTIDYRGADNLDNLETPKTLIANLDNTPPAATITISEPKYASNGKSWITSSTAITISSTDSGSGVKEIKYSIDGQPFSLHSSPFTFHDLPEGEHTIYYRSTDNLNNTEQEKSVKVIIDNTPSITSISIGGSKYTSDNKIWINNYTPITLSAEDVGIIPCGVKSIAYKIDETGWQISISPIGLIGLTEGEHTIYYYSTDNVNNTEQIKSVKVILDITPPVTAMSSSEPKYDNYITSSTIFALSPTDGGIIPSGVKYSQYNINNQFWSIYIQQFNITGADGIYTINYQSIDNVENWETIKSTTVKLDNTAPVSALSILEGKQYTSSDGKLYASMDTKYVLSAEDPVINEVASGMAVIEYSIDGSSFTIYTTSITLTEGIHTITYRGIDKLGNTESVKTFNVNVDNTPPVTQHTINGIQYTSDGKTYITPASVIGFTMADPVVSDVASGISYTKCRIDAGEFQNIPSTFTFTLAEGIHTVEYYSTDNVNNTEAVKQITLYVDNTAPVTTVTIGEPKYTAFGEIYISPETPVTLMATDPIINGVASGVGEILYSIDGSGFVKYISSFTLSEGVHTVGYRSIDNVQNTEETKSVKVTVTYISEYAAFGANEVKVNGQGKIYGSVRSNGNVKLDGQAFIDGDVSASSVTFTGQSKITGTIMQNAPTISTSAIDLAALQTLIAENNDNANLPQTQKGKPALVNGVLTLSGQDTITITTGTYYLAGINLSGQTKLYLSGVVRIFCTGKILISGQSEVYYSGVNPYNLVIYCNTTEPVTISGQGAMKGIIYAPSSDISISGQGITLSNIFGKTVSVDGQGKIVGVTYSQPPMLAMGMVKTASPLSDFVLGEVYSYPNPAKRGQYPTIHIEVGLADILEVRIYNVAGELIHSTEISGSNYKTINGKYAYEYNWDVSNIASGVYIYLVRAKKGDAIIKEMKKLAIIK